MTTAVLTIRDVQKAAGCVGATVNLRQSRYGEVSVDAPDGMVWSCSGTHMLVTSWWQENGKSPDFPEEKQSGLADVIERIQHGCEPCDLEDCDVCGRGDTLS